VKSMSPTPEAPQLREITAVIRHKVGLGCPPSGCLAASAVSHYCSNFPEGCADHIQIVVRVARY
jgi:hypothetical protein